MKPRNAAIVSLFLHQKLATIDERILQCTRITQSLQNQLTQEKLNDELYEKIATNLTITENAIQTISEVTSLLDEKELLFNILQLPGLEKESEQEFVAKSEIRYEEFAASLQQLISELEEVEMYEACQLIVNYQISIEELRESMSYASAS